MDKFLLFAKARKRWRKNGCSANAWSVYTDMLLIADADGLVLTSAVLAKAAAKITNHVSYQKAVADLVAAGLIKVMVNGSGKHPVYKINNL